MPISQENFIFILALFIILLIFYSIIQKRIKMSEECYTNGLSGLTSLDAFYSGYGMEIISHQQDDIYNISSRVQNQDQWPTHNAHVSIDHINIMNQMNKPIYDDAPPSYDEVMKTAPQNNGETSDAPPQVVVVVVPPTSRSQ